MAQKKCTMCHILKDISNYTSSPSTKDRMRNWCKQCFREYDIERRKVLTPEYKRGRSLVRYWPNLSPIDAYFKYEELLKSQNDACLICKRVESVKIKSLTVDHCHETGKVRGILCDICNLGLGNFKDNVELMERAIKYIKGEL